MWRESQSNNFVVQFYISTPRILAYSHKQEKKKKNPLRQMGKDGEAVYVPFLLEGRCIGRCLFS